MPKSIEQIQADYDRLIAHRARVIKYHDECPDGDIRKVKVEAQLNELNKRVCAVEKEFDSVI